MLLNSHFLFDTVILNEVNECINALTRFVLDIQLSQGLTITNFLIIFICVTWCIHALGNKEP